MYAHMVGRRREREKKEERLTASVGCPSSHDPGHDDGSCVFVTPYRSSLQSNQRGSLKIRHTALYFLYL